MEGIGIAAFVLSIIGIFIPVIGCLLAGLSGIFVFFSDTKKMALTLSAAIINIVNIFLLSPSLTAPIALARKHNKELVNNQRMFTVLVMIQIAAIIFLAVKKYRQKKNNI